MLQAREGTAALRDFDPAYARLGSDSVIRRCRFNVRFARKRTRLNGAQRLIALRSLTPRQRTRPRVFEQYRQRADVVNDPAHDQRRAGSLVRCSAAPLLLHDDRRADLDPVIEIDHVLIGHANAAR
jgi:hypothetical protein